MAGCPRDTAVLSPEELAGMLSTGDGAWQTPKPLFNKLDGIFHFDLDAAASDEDHLCRNYITAEDGALSMPWTFPEYDINAIWLNPPFGDQPFDWMVKVIREARQPHHPVIAVLHACRPSAKWWQLLRAHSKFMVFFDKRIKYVYPRPKSVEEALVEGFFSGKKKSPAFDSALAIVHKERDDERNKSWYLQLQQLGAVWWISR